MQAAGITMVGSAVMAAFAISPVSAQQAPVADWLDTVPASELTADLLIARKIEARCRNLRLSTGAEEVIDRRGGELSGYLNERRFGPSATSQPRIAAFEAKHHTTYAGTNSLCRAGYLEMKEGTGIGRLLQTK